MIQKILLTISFILILSSFTTSVFAQEKPTNQNEKIFYNFKDLIKTEEDSKIGIVAKLPDKTWQQIITSVIKVALAISGSLALAAFTVSGVLILVAQGEEDKITKGKKNLIWSIIALIIIATSYAIVFGVSQLQYFSS